MRNNPLFKRLRQIALDKGYTIEQVEAVTKKQIEKLLDAKLKTAFADNMKRCIIQELRIKEWEQMLRLVKDKVKVYFPRAEFERDNEGDKPRITIWPKGKPEGI